MQRPPGSTVREPQPGAGAGYSVQSAGRAENSEVVVKCLEPRIEERARSLPGPLPQSSSGP